MKKITIKKDTEGRFYLPAKIRKELGTTLTLKKTQKGLWRIFVHKGVTKKALIKCFREFSTRTNYIQPANP